ncbi:kinesin-like protein KIF18A [Limulus polyphemus]|uniref:Kinesin-like protein KIF18A n=1 Tax=Limulus polyphemus TaxID=6850 RepID=A0ABM1SWC0_LIMPO|nr:kinesin-like protein KIF18A [Limulus polyphemus]
MIVKSNKTPLGRGGRRRSLTNAIRVSNVFSPRSRRISNGSSLIKKNSIDSCMKVVVRVRPENDREQSENFHTVVRSLDKHLLVFDPKEDGSDFYFHGKKQVRRDLLKRPNRDLKFAFDHVFGPEESNQDVFQSTTKSIIDGLLNGYNCSVFAYGATGAGKTHTMLGTPSNPGLTFLTVMELYERIESIKEDKICDISVSYLEVYNETIRDLLMPSPPLAVREDPQRGVVVSGLSYHKPKDAEHLLNMLDFGNKNRTQHPTDANAESSRSHAVFQVCVKQQNRTADLSTNVQVAKMSLIDLAGSERACAAAAHGGVRQREGANINKSLLALGNCINALADRKNKGQHIPYRNSKLTRILKDCLGGNCKTVMIAAVSPSSISYEDTYNTLKYADRAKSIQLDLKKNVISVEAHVTKYVKIVDDLKKEISELKEKLSVYENEKMFPKNVPATVETRQDSIQQPYVTCDKPVCVHEDEIEEFIPYSTKMSALFKEGQRIRRAYLECESSLKQIQGKIQWRMTYLDRISLLSIDRDKLSKSTSKADAAICSLKGKQTRLEARKTDLVNELQKNIEELKKLEEGIENYYTEDRNKKLVCENLKLKFHQHCLETEVRDLRQQNRHSQQVAMMLETEASRTERLLSPTLKLVRQLEILLDGHGFLTSDLKSLYDCLVKQAEGEKGVMWADESRKSGGLSEPVHLLTLSTYSVLPITPTSQPTRTPLITILNPSPNTEDNNMPNFINPKNSEENLAFPLSPVEEINTLKDSPCPSLSRSRHGSPHPGVNDISFHHARNSQDVQSVKRSLNETFQNIPSQQLLNITSPVLNVKTSLNQTFTGSCLHVSPKVTARTVQDETFAVLPEEKDEFNKTFSKGDSKPDLNTTFTPPPLVPDTNKTCTPTVDKHLNGTFIAQSLPVNSPSTPLQKITSPPISVTPVAGHFPSPAGRLTFADVVKSALPQNRYRHHRRSVTSDSTFVFPPTPAVPRPVMLASQVTATPASPLYAFNSCLPKLPCTSVSSSWCPIASLKIPKVTISEPSCSSVCTLTSNIGQHSSVEVNGRQENIAWFSEKSTSSKISVDKENVCKLNDETRNELVKVNGGTESFTSAVPQIQRGPLGEIQLSYHDKGEKSSNGSRKSIGAHKKAPFMSMTTSTTFKIKQPYSRKTTKEISVNTPYDVTKRLTKKPILLKSSTSTTPKHPLSARKSMSTSSLRKIC